MAQKLRQWRNFFGVTFLEAPSATISKLRSKPRVPRVSRPLGPKLITISTFALFSSVLLFIWFWYCQVYLFSETNTLREVSYLLPFFAKILNSSLVLGKTSTQHYGTVTNGWTQKHSNEPYQAIPKICMGKTEITWNFSMNHNTFLWPDEIIVVGINNVL